MNQITKRLVLLNLPYVLMGLYATIWAMPGVWLSRLTFLKR